MSGNEITFGLAILAGMASFLSPCVLSLVPAYIGYLGGRAVPAGTGDLSVQYQDSRMRTFMHGVAFVVGFSVIFIALGAAASALGQALFDVKTLLARIGGVVVIIFGLHTMGVFTIPFLDYDTRKQYTRTDEGASYGSSFLMGIFFSAGWAPCVGPVLGAVLTMAITAEGLSRGVVLLTAYSMGLAVPFLLAALAIGQATLLIRRMGRYMRYIQIGNGILLIAIGLLLLSGQLEKLARYGFFIDFGI